MQLFSFLLYRSRTILDDFREAYFWLRQNTGDKARVMSWWDYGYQIAGMGNKTTLVDNNTWNNSHIALVSMLLFYHILCCESQNRFVFNNAHKVMQNIIFFFSGLKNTVFPSLE